MSTRLHFPMSVNAYTRLASYFLQWKRFFMNLTISNS